jgi:hypothetical protein
MLKGISALDKWLARSTWHTGHPIDMEIFYSAVKEIISQNPNVPARIRDCRLHQKLTVRENRSE